MILKTLKDLDIEREKEANLSDDSYGRGLVEGTKLKQEAIKWIKDLENDGEESWVGNSSDYPYAERTISFIKHFFNISNSDLKEAENAE